MSDYSEEDRGRTDNKDNACKVFITNIEGSQSEETVQTELNKLFSNYGQVISLNVKKNKNASYSFAFVQMDKPEEAAKAIQELDQIDFCGKKMRV